MIVTRTIKLELLRHGPPHNQLLSPLTPYLALCGNHEPQTVYVPLEQRDFLIHVSALRYQTLDVKQRGLHLTTMAREIQVILNNIPGLKAEFGSNGKSDELAHLRLIYSASELSLLPFELAISPSAFPGSGKQMALQTNFPLCLTRESRRGSTREIAWATRPRILFIASDAGGSIPLDAHAEALIRAVAPWVSSSTEKPFSERAKSALRILPDATLQSIEKICSEEPGFTHIHILAHGGEYLENGETRYGLVFKSEDGPVTASAQQLACAILGPRKGINGNFSRPCVVTLSACDSGNQGSLVMPGSSLAHYLHSEGVPLVVGSQFPLTFDGSILMVSTLYERLLWGDDPRLVLHGLRMQLGRLNSDVHDWASLVAYATFPADLESQLVRVRAERGRSARVIAMDSVKWAVEGAGVAATTTQHSRSTQQTRSEMVPEFRQALERLDTAGTQSINFAAEVETQGIRREFEKQVEVLKSLGAYEKQRAQIAACLINILGNSETQEIKDLQRKRNAAIESSAQYYQRAYKFAPEAYWLGVQVMVMQTVQRKYIDAEQWKIFVLTAEHELKASKKKKSWGLVNLINLCLVAIANSNVESIAEGFCEKVINYGRELAGLYSIEKRQVTNCARQLLRFIYWWELDVRVVQKATAILNEMCAHQPDLQKDLNYYVQPVNPMELLKVESSLAEPIPSSINAPMIKTASRNYENTNDINNAKNDPNKGNFNPVSKNIGNGRILEVPGGIQLTKSSNLFRIDLLVTAMPSALPLTGEVTFHLHPSFPSSVRTVSVRKGRAKLTLFAWGSFTVGAVADGGNTRLEYDLSEVPDAPSIFKTR